MAFIPTGLRFAAIPRLTLSYLPVLYRLPSDTASTPYVVAVGFRTPLLAASLHALLPLSRTGGRAAALLRVAAAGCHGPRAYPRYAVILAARHGYPHG